MGATALVSEDVAAGHAVIEALDSGGFPVAAAFWLYDSERDVWKLWIGTPRAGKDLQLAYMKVSENFLRGPATGSSSTCLGSSSCGRMIRRFVR
jgi:hypothetical protein